MGLEREIEKNNAVKEEIKASLDASKHIFANQIKNGLGEDIKKTLLNPPQLTKKQIRKIKIKNFLDKIFGVS